MKNVKEFVKEHKLEIAGCLAVTVVGGIAYYLGWNDGIKHVCKTKYVVDDEVVKRVLRSASAVEISESVVGGFNIAEPFMMEQLGELGEYLMKEVGVDKAQKFTHFIMIGPKVVKES